jgi:hypothetical protein
MPFSVFRTSFNHRSIVVPESWVNAGNTKICLFPNAQLLTCVRNEALPEEDWVKEDGELLMTGCK